MEKIIWALDDNKKNLYDIQRAVNSAGSMRVRCIISYDALENIMDELVKQEYANAPALIVINYDKLNNEEFRSLRRIKSDNSISGVPVFFAIEHKSEELEELCLQQGAVGVISSRPSKLDVQRLENMAWQFETAKSMESKLEKQSKELAMAREIKRLNKQLSDRNELLHKLFGKYFSDDVLSQILEKSEFASIGGEKKDMTVMMTDLRGFTALSQTMEPDSLMNLLNYYFSKMVDIIMEYKGTIIEFVGDGILAVFGAPVHYDVHVDYAVAAAINMQNAMREVDTFCYRKGYPLLNMGIGIHTGDAYIGNIGSEKLMRYNVIGNVVNECSRIESYSVGGQIFISDVALKSMKSSYRTRSEKKISVKGLEQPMRIWDICGMRGLYQCELEQRSEVPMVKLERPVNVYVFEVRGKMIKRECKMGRLKKISEKEAYIEMKTGKLDCLSDIKIFATDEEGYILFENIYAKVVKEEGRGYIITFTYINDSISEIVKKIGGNKMIVVNEEFAICDSGEIEKNYDEYKYVLIIARINDDVVLTMTSSDKDIRAIEICDFLLPEFALIKGDAVKAEGKISYSVLNSMMIDADISDVKYYFEQKVREYYEECDWIYSCEYAKSNEEMIRGFDMYQKKDTGWGVVKTTDIVPAGRKLYLKTMENESGEVVIADEENLIMVGCKGEIYSIVKEKFDKTYEVTDEKIDVFGQMLEFLPEVMTYPQKEYINIDEKAYICHPKKGLKIYAKQLEKRTKIFGKYIENEYFLGREGDYMAIRSDDIEDIYIIQKDVLEKSYEKANDDLTK